MATTSWTGDHDLNCGTPDTQRTIQRAKPSDSFYMCRDHMMTSIGDTSGYSTGWFTPKQTFTGATQVSWDVNVTDLKARQWWEVAIVPASFNSGVAVVPAVCGLPWTLVTTQRGCRDTRRARWSSARGRSATMSTSRPTGSTATSRST